MADKDLDMGLEPNSVWGEEGLNRKPVWFGVYLKTNEVKVKRYYSWGDYKEAGDSDFVAFTTRLFEADCVTDATKIAVGMVKARCMR